MRRRGGHGVEDLAICGVVAYEIVPSSFSELAPSGGGAALGRARFETREPLLDPFGTIIGGRTLLSRAAAEAPRYQTREGNTDCSTHWHCIASFSLGFPLRANELRFPLQ
jgi:hypothetical protein